MEDIVLFFLLHSTIRESCHSSRTLNLLSAAVSCRLSADCGSLLQPVRLQNHLPFSLDPDVPFIHHHQYPESISSFTTHSFTASSSTMTSRWSLTTLRTLTSSYCARDGSGAGSEPVLCVSTPSGINTCWSSTKNHCGQGLGANDKRSNDLVPAQNQHTLVEKG